MHPLLSRCVEAIWAAFGQAAPPDRIEGEHQFEIDGVRFTAALTPAQTAVLLRADLGQISPERYTAQSQLQRLLQISLALSATNPAALRWPEGTLAPTALDFMQGLSDKSLVIQSEVVLTNGTEKETINALNHLLHWTDLTLSFLDPIGEARRSAEVEPDNRAYGHAELVIFQP